MRRKWADSSLCSLRPHGETVIPQCAQGVDYLTTPWGKERTDRTQLSRFPIPWPSSTMSNRHDLNAIVCDTID